MMPGRRVLPVPLLRQPDVVSCGPTCLLQVMQFYGDPRRTLTLRRNPDGGTLAVYLGLAALDAGYKVIAYPLGVRIFDPTWWRLPRQRLLDRLAQRAEAFPADAIEVLAWREFLSREGSGIRFVEPSAELLMRILDRDHPIICGLSATWLYREPRERPEDNISDDIRGAPVGHFVVVAGYSHHGLRLFVRDPWPSGLHERPLSATRLINAILLGDVTSDAVLIEIYPRKTGPLSHA